MWNLLLESSLPVLLAQKSSIKIIFKGYVRNIMTIILKVGSSVVETPLLPISSYKRYFNSWYSYISPKLLINLSCVCQVKYVYSP